MGTPRFTPEFKEEAVRQITERGYSVAKTGELTPVAITAVTFPLLIDAAVNDNTILGSDETIKLDGNVTISVQYL